VWSLTQWACMQQWSAADSHASAVFCPYMSPGLSAASRAVKWPAAPRTPLVWHTSAKHVFDVCCRLQRSRDQPCAASEEHPQQQQGEQAAAALSSLCISGCTIRNSSKSSCSRRCRRSLSRHVCCKQSAPAAAAHLAMGGMLGA
jgi:hypothetical protein